MKKKVLPSGFGTIIPSIAAFVCAIMLIACSSDKEETNTSTSTLADKIIGKWMCYMADGKPCPTNNYYVLNFVSPTKVYRSYSPSTSMGFANLWENEAECSVRISGNKFTINAQYSTALKTESEYAVISFSETDMDVSAKHRVTYQGRQIDMPDHSYERLKRITKDYSQDIIGIWEGRSTSVQSEHDDGLLHRWEYKTDGTYVYYSQDDDGQWVRFDDEYTKYFVDGVLLCSRWKNNGEDTEQREWWEIESIQNGVMKWTALRRRDNGTTYTASFQMTKVQ